MPLTQPKEQPPTAGRAAGPIAVFSNSYPGVSDAYQLCQPETARDNDLDRRILAQGVGWIATWS
jgi:hypothetical protein